VLINNVRSLNVHVSNAGIQSRANPDTARWHGAELLVMQVSAVRFQQPPIF